MPPHTHLSECPRNCTTPNYKTHFRKGSYFSNFGLKIVFNDLKNLVCVVTKVGGGAAVHSVHTAEDPVLGKGRNPRSKTAL